MSLAGSASPKSAWRRNPPNSHSMSDYDFDDEDTRTFWQRYRWTIVGGMVALVAGAFILPNLLSGDGAPARHKPEVAMMRVSLPPPPAPPPPPPPPPPPQKIEEKQPEKMVEQEPVEKEEAKPEPPPADEPPASITTGIVGNGPADGFGLGGGPGGNGRGGSGFGGNGKKGSRFGYYAAQVQTRIADALRNNRKTNRAAARTELRVWSDDTGRITKVKLAQSTGDPAVDTAIENEVLPGLRLEAPPPADMPMPIVMRFTARRPN